MCAAVLTRCFILKEENKWTLCNQIHPSNRLFSRSKKTGMSLKRILPQLPLRKNEADPKRMLRVRFYSWHPEICKPVLRALKS